MYPPVEDGFWERFGKRSPHMYHWKMQQTGYSPSENLHPITPDMFGIYKNIYIYIYLKRLGVVSGLRTPPWHSLVPSPIKRGRLSPCLTTLLRLKRENKVDAKM